MLRSLGYEGFTDKTGMGVIHKNEPTQAVFFSIKPIKLVEIIKNKKEKGFSNAKEYAAAEDKNFSGV